MKRMIIILMMLSISHSALAQYDSTNLPSLTASAPPMVNFGGTNLPIVTTVDQDTTYTEAEVLACPTSGGNGYGYYPNGPVPTDGSSTVDNVQGGVIEERSVTVTRFGTTVYGDWTQVNFLCTAIPSPPACQSGYTQTSAPYWDSNTNQWVGLQCKLVQQTVCNYGNGTAFEFITQTNGQMWFRTEWNNNFYGSSQSNATPVTSWQDAVNQSMVYGMYPENTTVQYTVTTRLPPQTITTYYLCNNGSVVPNN